LKRDAARLNLFLTHQAALVDYATPIVGDRTRAEDVVQEAFIRFVPLDRKAGQAVDQPVAYLYRIVRNLALDWTRRRAIEQRHGGAEPLWWMLPDTPRTPEQDMLHRRDLARIGAALDELAPEMRLAVEMHRFGGYTLTEIAGRLNVSVPTAHRMIRDALVDIASRLGPAPND
jgi:RNA polymerase sigma-70 factor (ECF subfamily)